MTDTTLPVPLPEPRYYIDGCMVVQPEAIEQWARACMAPLQERADALQEKFNSADLMAQCMAGLRGDCIKAGVVDESVPPMMYPEEIIPRLLRADALEEALREVLDADKGCGEHQLPTHHWPEGRRAAERLIAALAAARSLINPTGGES